MFLNQLLNSIQVRGFESIICRQFNWEQPELCFVFRGLYMNVWRLFSLLLKKKKRNRPTRRTVGKLTSWKYRKIFYNTLPTCANRSLRQAPGVLKKQLHIAHGKFILV